MFIITSNNKTPQSLRSHSCLPLLRRRYNGGQLTQGGSVLKPKTDATVNQQSWERPGYVWHHTANNLWTWSEKGVMIYGDLKKKKHWVDFYYYRVVVFTHCQHTFQFKQHVKVNFACDDPFKVWAYTNLGCYDLLWCYVGCYDLGCYVFCQRIWTNHKTLKTHN